MNRLTGLERGLAGSERSGMPACGRMPLPLASLSALNDTSPGLPVKRRTPVPLVSI